MDNVKTLRLSSFVHPGGQVLKVINIHGAASALVLFLNRRLEKYGLTVNKLNVLQLLADNHNLTMNDLKERVGDKGCDLSRMIGHLQTQGLLIINTHSADRRSRQVNITPRGIQMLNTIFETAFDAVETEQQNFNGMVRSLQGVLATETYRQRRVVAG
jgi:DNA-binding MarR family transcriptional regulator